MPKNKKSKPFLAGCFKKNKKCLEKQKLCTNFVKQKRSLNFIHHKNFAYRPKFTLIN